ncbi:hypothetical protein [Burkholderia multivorans]|uniref:hypothetical protein n=1 Tax=Burkholderia multivorans TaxID=87883 RepID=UPI000D007A86|nr:hypothetical protein [Burkholderia multivorans]PRG18000.1 hypothetical protein C6T62_28930 [Burkholderia multivorans]
MIDQDKMRALAKCLRADADFAGERESGSFDLRYEAADAIDLLLAEVEAAAADKRDQFARLLTIIEKDSEWADARAVDWTRGVLMATLKVALAQRQGEGS